MSKINIRIIMERFDRFLYNPLLLNLSLDSIDFHLPRVHSDHCPLLLNLIKNNKNPNSKFTFETMCLCHLKFKNIHKNYLLLNYNYLHASNAFSQVVTNWNKEMFGNICKTKKNILPRLDGLQKLNPTRKNKFHYILETSQLQEYNNILKQNVEFWKLKSRVQWVLKGDASTKFFSYLNCKKRHRNRILSLVDSVEIWTFDPDSIKYTITKHFEVV